MKINKKIASMLLSICMVLLFAPMVVYAASAKVSFTDLTTEAGEDFEIRIKVTSDGASIGSIEMGLDYDEQAIQFLSGEGVTEDSGLLTYSATGDSTELITTLTFKALKFGESKITINSSLVSDVDGNEMEVAEGNSTISVEGGTEVEPSEIEEANTSVDSNDLGEVVQVDGIDYRISNGFSTNDIPVGYSQTQYEYNGTSYNGVTGDTSGIVLGYLVDTSSTGKFFVYDATTLSFTPFVQMSISDSTYIVFARTAVTENIPTRYLETTLTVNGHEFITWEDTENSGFYLINAINSMGETKLYKYDSLEQTYQRYIVEEDDSPVVEENTEEEDAEQAVGSSNMMIALIGLTIVLVVLIIVLFVKLRKRTKEVDALYEEFGFINIAEGTEVEEIENKKDKKKKKKETEDFDNLKLDSSIESDFNGEIIGNPIVGSSIAISDELEKEFDDEFEDEFDDEFEDEFDDEFEDEFDDEFEDEFDGEFEDEFEDEFDDELEEVSEGNKLDTLSSEFTSVPKRSIKSVSANRKNTNVSLDDDIDFIDI